jgi:hypothetical protein
MSVAEEIILPFAEPFERIEPVNAVRSTLLASSIQSLRSRELLPRYTSFLPEVYRDVVLHCIAGQWFPLEVGFAHYRACDALGLTTDEQREIGSDVSRRIQESLLGTILQVAKKVGVTPWSVLPKTHQLISRSFRGGGTQVTKLGEQDALVEVGKQPLLEINYFRTAMLGLFETAVGMFSKRAEVRFLAARSRQPASLTAMHVSWI